MIVSTVGHNAIWAVFCVLCYVFPLICAMCSLCSVLCVPFDLCYVFCVMCSLCSALPRILSSPHNSQLSSNLSCSGEHSCNSFSSLSFCHGCHPTPVMLLSRLCCVIFSESCDWHDQYFDCSLNFHRPNNWVER